MSPEGDPAAAREISTVASFDLGVAGVFKVLDPAGFLADLKAEGSRSIRSGGRTPAPTA